MRFFLPLSRPNLRPGKLFLGGRLLHERVLNSRIRLGPLLRHFLNYHRLLIRANVLELACQRGIMSMKILHMLRRINQNHDHAGLVFFHQIVQLVLNCCRQSGRMLDHKIFPLQLRGDGADPQLIQLLAADLRHRIFAAQLFVDPLQRADGSR